MIKQLSKRRRLPRAGIIRLGIKVQKPGGKEYPKETDYFVCPDIVRETYGAEPKELLIMFPVESEDIFFQQFYKKYGNGVLLCKGDGETADFYDFEAKEFAEKECPCKDLESGSCKIVGVLQFLLYDIKEAVGVFQISTGSKNSIIDINSGIDMIRGICGRIAMIPLILKRELMTTQKIDDGEVIKGKHYTMKLSIGVSLMEIQKLGQIPPHLALLPKPLETLKAVEDLFPKNGFDPDQKEDREPVPKEETEPKQIEAETPAKEETTKTEAPSDNISTPEISFELTECKKELSGIIEKVRVFRELTEGESVKLDSLVTLSEYKNKIIYWKRELSKVEPK